MVGLFLSPFVTCGAPIERFWFSQTSCISTWPILSTQGLFGPKLSLITIKVWWGQFCPKLALFGILQISYSNHDKGRNWSFWARSREWQAPTDQCRSDWDEVVFLLDHTDR